VLQFTEHYEDDRIKKDKLDRIAAYNGNVSNVYKSLVGIPEGNRPL
jgi:hypothetical protein